MLWYAKVANWKISRLVLPVFVKVATDEKMSHRQALKNISEHWDNIQCPVLHYHGTDDSIAPYTENIEFSKNNIKPELLTMVTEQDGGHLLIWFKGATFKELIIDFIRQN